MKKDSFDVKLAQGLDTLVTRTETYPAIIRYPLAYFFIILGLLLIVLPGPGTVFLLAGIALLSKRFAVFLTRQLERYVNWRRQRLNKQTA
jgi:hypothetical protein